MSEENEKTLSEIIDQHLNGDMSLSKEERIKHRIELINANMKAGIRTNDGVRQAIEAAKKNVTYLPKGTLKGKQLPPRVSEYAKAEAYNALHGAAPAAVEAERLKICGGCEFRLTTYKGATDPDNFGWCSKCGCGNNPRALLVTKAKLAQVSCPLTPPRWDKVEGVGGSVASVVDSVKGVAQSIKHLLTGNKDTPPPTN